MKIGIFATSSPVRSAPEVDHYKYLKSKGHEIFEHPQVRKVLGHTAGTIQERVDALHEMLQDDSIDMLLAFWGGANTNQILPYLDYQMFAKFPKPVIGFSDTTALLLAVHKLSGIKTYVGPGGITFDKPEPFDYTYDYFSQMLMESKSEIVIEDSPKYADDLYFLREDSDHRILKENEGRQVFKHGKAKGEVIASNLQTLLVLAGTDYFPELEGKVLFIEEAEEVDTSMTHRFFTHLSQVTDLNKLSAICVGRFCEQTGFSDNDSEKMIYEDIFSNIEIPVLYNLDYGHSDPMFTVANGSTCEIDTQEGVLKFSDFKV